MTFCFSDELPTTLTAEGQTAEEASNCFEFEGKDPTSSAAGEEQRAWSLNLPDASRGEQPLVVESVDLEWWSEEELFVAQ
mmetsp:Transcript_256/g.505  ORF Transcript_256/g.505 Transcript_256/m.505 type:complete len:80 (-) Transcript_256:147-386(-)